MDKSERNKLKLKELVDLIVQAPLYTYDENATMKNMEADIARLAGRLDTVFDTASKNQQEIANLKTKNTDLERHNLELRRELNELKNNQAEEADVNDQNEIEALRKEVNEIQQYLRINNLEIVGLPAANEGESEETLLVNALNSLDGLRSPIRHEDIDISHPLKTRRTDEKKVHVVRFISRKTKAEILAAKKLDANQDFKFRNSDIFINEHLAPHQRTLFATAAGKKKALKYKFLWTRGGSIFMRKTENSEVISINSVSGINNLT